MLFLKSIDYRNKLMNEYFFNLYLIYDKFYKDIDNIGFYLDIFFVVLGGYNIIKGKDYLVPSNNIFSGRNGDIGFYEQTEYTYYIQNGDTEILYNDKLYIPLGFCYLHLKYLKPNFGLENAPEKKKELWKANIISSKKVPIEKITKDFSTTMIKKIIDPILNRNYLSKKGNEE